MELRLYFQLVKRGWWIVLLTILVALGIALGLSRLAKPQYTAVARFLIIPGTGSTATPDITFQALNTINNGNIASTYAQVMTSNRILTDALALMKLPAQDLQAFTYKADVLPNSTIIELTVIGPNAKTAAEFANALGTKTIALMRQLNPVINIDFLDQAVPPALPSSPQPVRNAALAGVLGLIVGLLLAVVSEQMGTSLETFREGLRVDNLTGAYSRKYLPRIVEAQLSRNPEQPLSVGIVELTGLSDLVGSLPMSLRQKAMKLVVDALRHELRGGDVIGRWDDVSFGLILPQTTSTAASGILGRILHALSTPVTLNGSGMTVNLDAHIGGAQYDANQSPRQLFDEAYEALEEARRDNSSQVHVFQPGQTVASQNQLAES